MSANELTNDVVIKIHDRSKLAFCRETLALCATYSIIVEDMTGDGFLVIYRPVVMPSNFPYSPTRDWSAPEENGQWLCYCELDEGEGTLNLSTDRLVSYIGKSYPMNSVATVKFSVYDSSEGLLGTGDMTIRVCDAYQITSQSFISFKGDTGAQGPQGPTGPAGTTDFEELSNRPTINGVYITKTSTASDLGLATASDLNTLGSRVSTVEAQAQTIDNKLNKSTITDAHFENVSTGGGTLKDVRLAVESLISKLSGLVPLVLLTFGCCGAITKDTVFEDIPPTNTIYDIGEFARLKTNVVEDLIIEYDTTNITPRLNNIVITNADGYVEANGFVATNEIGCGIYAIESGKRSMLGVESVDEYTGESSWSSLSHNELLITAGDIKIGGNWFMSGYGVSIEGDNTYGTISIGDPSYLNTVGTLYVNGTNVMTEIGSKADGAIVDAWENYWSGDRVRLSVTNYYGNTSGELPRLRVEESITNNAGTVVGWRTVWDEYDRSTNTIAFVCEATNAAITTIKEYASTNYAPLAWGRITSTGEIAPSNTVWLTEPNTVFAGGTEYAHVAVGEGAICVLVDKGAPTYTALDEGKLKFIDDSGENYFGFSVRTYTFGCRTDGISVNTVDGNTIVTLVYDLTSASNPDILYCTDLNEANWEQATVSWDQNPPANQKRCFINAGTNPQGFYKAQITSALGAKFITNMQADLAGGIAASNETQNTVQTIEPYIVNGQVLWRVKQ